MICYILYYREPGFNFKLSIHFLFSVYEKQWNASFVTYE